MGMDVDWPYRKRELGDTILYTCPSSKLTWEERLEQQVVTCIWHRQTDTMMWWPQDLHQCNSKTRALWANTGVTCHMEMMNVTAWWPTV